MFADFWSTCPSTHLDKSSWMSWELSVWTQSRLDKAASEHVFKTPDRLGWWAYPSDIGIGFLSAVYVPARLHNFMHVMMLWGKHLQGPIDGSTKAFCGIVGVLLAPQLFGMHITWTKVNDLKLDLDHKKCAFLPPSFEDPKKIYRF